MEGNKETKNPKSLVNLKPLWDVLDLKSNLNKEILMDWITQNTNLKIKLVNYLQDEKGNILNLDKDEIKEEYFIKEIKDKKTIKNKPIYEILIPDDVIKEKVILQKIQEYLRKHSFINKNENLQKEDKKISLNQRMFNYKVGKYLNSIINKYSNELDNNNKQDLKYLGDAFQDFSGLDTKNFDYLKKEIDNKNLTDEEIKNVEKYLVGENIYLNLQKKIENKIIKNKENKNKENQETEDIEKENKLKLIKKYLNVLISSAKKKENSIKSNFFLNKHQNSINKERIDDHEILRLINEYGIQDIFLDQNFVDKSLLIKFFNFFKKEEKRYINLKSKVEKIKRDENISSENKVKEIIRLIENTIKYYYWESGKEYQRNVKYSLVSPKSFQENLLTQCVGYTQLGKYLEDMSNVYYLPINISRHSLSLTLINDELYFTDITNNRFQKLFNSDFTNGEKDISLLKKYAKGEETKSQTISFSRKFLYEKWMTNPSIFLHDKREVISLAILNNLASLYYKQSQRKENKLKKEELENKAEKYYLLAIEKGEDINVINNLGVFYQKQSQREENKLKIEELENKAEKYYLLAMEKGGDLNVINNLVKLYYIKFKREENKLKKEKLEKIISWLWNMSQVVNYLTKEEYQELIEMVKYGR